MKPNWLNLAFKIRQAKLELRAEQAKFVLEQAVEQLERLDTAYREILEILKEMEQADGPH